MKIFLEKIRSFFLSLAARFKRNPKDAAGTHATNEPPTSPRKSGKMDRFTIISWSVTAFIVVSLLGSTILYKNARASSAVNQPQATPDAGGEVPVVSAPVTGSDGGGFSAI